MQAGSISFSTSLDNTQLEKQLAGLAKKIEKEERNLADLTAKRAKAQEKSLFDAAVLDAEKAKLQEVKDRLADIRAMSKDKTLSLDTREKAKALLPSVQEELRDQQTRVKALQAEWNKTENAVDRYTTQLDQAQAALERQKMEAGYLQEQLTRAEQVRRAELESAEISDRRIVAMNRELLELKERQKELEQSGIGPGYQEYDQNAARIAELTARLKEYKRALEDAGRGGPDSAEEVTRWEKIRAVLAGIKSGLEKPLRVAQTLLGVLYGLEKGFLNAAASAVKLGAAGVKAFSRAVMGIGKLLTDINIFNKMFGILGKSLRRLGMMLRRVFVFSVITSGLRAVRTQMSAYLSLNTEFTSALRQLKGVLLTAFQPIYDAAVPALTVLLNLLSKAIAVVSEFTAVLFGTTAKKAQASAKALYSQAEALKATGSAAEDAAGSLAGFDEINTINTDTGGGSGAGSTDTSPLFDYDYDDTVFESWGEAFSAFLDKLLAGIPKLESALGRFADWFNGLTGKLYDMFTFPGVLEKVQQLGRDLAGAFNQLVNKVNWHQLGQALGAGMNLAFQFLVSFVYTFDWMNLGRRLAECVNGLVSQVDWYDFGRLLWAGFKISLEMLAGFLLGLDMSQLAQAASSIVQGFFDEMINTLKRIPWGEIGTQIAIFLNQINWVGVLSGLAGAIAAGISAVIDTLAALASQLEWGKIGTAVGLALNKLFADIDWAKAGKTFGDGLNGLITMAIQFLETADWAGIGRDMVAFFENIDWKMLFSNLGQLVGDAIVAALELFTSNPAGLLRIGADIVLGIMMGITNQLLTIGAWLKENLVDPIVNGVKDLLGIHSPSTVMAEIGVMLILGLFQGISNTWNTITEFFGEKLSALQQTLSDAWSSIKTAAANAWSTIKGDLGQKWSEIRDSAQTKFTELKTKISEIWENTKAEAAQKWESIKAVLSQTWTQVHTSAQERFSEVKQSIIDKMGELKTHDWMSIGSSIMNGIWDGLKKVWESVASWARSAADALGNIFNGAKSAASSIKNTVSSAFSGGRMALQAVPEISMASIPALAQGAVIPPNREFMAVLGDQRHGNNLEGPEDMFRKIVREEAGAGADYMPVLQAILEAIQEGSVIVMDGKALTKGIVRNINTMTRQSGRSVLLG